MSKILLLSELKIDFIKFSYSFYWFLIYWNTQTKNIQKLKRLNKTCKKYDYRKIMWPDNNNTYILALRILGHTPQPFLCHLEKQSVSSYGLQKSICQVSLNTNYYIFC